MFNERRDKKEKLEGNQPSKVSRKEGKQIGKQNLGLSSTPSKQCKFN